jgi:hypothetical protein
MKRCISTSHARKWWGCFWPRDLRHSMLIFSDETWHTSSLHQNLDPFFGHEILSYPSSTSLGFLYGIFKDCFEILSINRKIFLENKSYYREGVALRMNQSFAFEFLCENFQPKLIKSYSNFKRFFHFLLCDLGTKKSFKTEIWQRETLTKNLDPFLKFS